MNLRKVSPRNRLSRNLDTLTVSIIDPVGGHGGMDYYDISLCNALSRAGIKPLLFTCEKLSKGPKDNFRVFHSYKGVFSGKRIRSGLTYIRSTLQTGVISITSGSRICHIQNFNASILDLFLVATMKLMGMRIIITIHDPESFNPEFGSLNIAKRLYKSADCAVVHNRLSRETVFELYGLRSENVVVIPHGNYIDYTKSVPTITEARSKLKVNGVENVILFLGQIKNVKGLEVLLRAMQPVVDELPNTVLLIAGKVWQDDWGKYEEIIGMTGIKRNVLARLEYIPNEDVPFYYSAADLVVLPYMKIFQSGALLMAMSYGKAVITSNIEGMKGIIVDGETGCLFKVGDHTDLARALIKLLKDTDLRETLGANARKLMENEYSWSRIGERTGTLYRKVLRQE